MLRICLGSRVSNSRSNSSVFKEKNASQYFCKMWGRTILIALFTNNFIHLHYNTIQREHEAISGYFVIFARNCLVFVFNSIVMQVWNIIREKGYLITILRLTWRPFQKSGIFVHGSLCSLFVGLYSGYLPIVLFEEAKEGTKGTSPLPKMAAKSTGKDAILLWKPEEYFQFCTQIRYVFPFCR